MAGSSASAVSRSTSNNNKDIKNSFDDRIFFVAIVRNDETLVKYAQFAGNFDQILGQVMPKIVKTNGIKMTFNYEEYFFFT